MKVVEVVRNAVFSLPYSPCSTVTAWRSARPGEFRTLKPATFANRVVRPPDDFCVLKLSKVTPSTLSRTKGVRASGLSKPISTFLKVRPFPLRM